MPYGIISIYTITYIIDGSSDSSNEFVDYNGQEVDIINWYFTCICILLYQTQTYEITGLSPYQLVTVTITATNGGGTSDPSNEVFSRSNEAGDCSNLLK